MPGHVCTICASSALTKRAVELIAQRVKDRDAAVELGLGDNDAGRMIYNRHRRNCVEKPERGIIVAAGEGTRMRWKIIP